MSIIVYLVSIIVVGLFSLLIIVVSAKRGYQDIYIKILPFFVIKLNQNGRVKPHSKGSDDNAIEKDEEMTRKQKIKQKIGGYL